MGVPVICVQRAYLMNNVLIVLQFRHKLVLQFFGHLEMVG